MNKTIFTLLLIFFGYEFLVAQPSADFVTTWKTDNPGISGPTQITIPTFPGETYNYDVDWDNDGVFDSLGVTGNITHDYGVADTVTIRIRGAFPRIYFNDLFATDSDKLLTIEQWGDIAWTSMEGAFSYCSNLNITNPLAGSPDLSQVTSTADMFKECEKFNAAIDAWNVGTVTNMRSMFRTTTAFNQNLDNWDVRNVTDMSYMFRDAKAFNGSIGTWDVSQVKFMNNMFEAAKSFNQPIGGWKVGNVTNMGVMFASAAAFNQDLNDWDVGQVTKMDDMFYESTSFNGNIGSWNVGQVQGMEFMFAGALSFDQNIGAWDVSNVFTMNEMFDEVTLSTANYDSLLLGWSQRSLHSGVKFSAGNSQYCAGAAARQAIIDNFGWTITDGGLECVVGTDDPTMPDALLVFPNPTTGLVTVQAGGYENAGRVRLLDQNGRCVLSRNVDQQELLPLDLSMLPAGVYTLQYTGKSGSAQARVVKQ